MKSLLVPLFITGAVSIEAQTAMAYSFVAQPDHNVSSNQSDRLCTQINQTDSCLRSHPLIGRIRSISFYPGLFRKATNLLLPQWQSSWHPRQQVQLYDQTRSLTRESRLRQAPSFQKSASPGETPGVTGGRGGATVTESVKTEQQQYKTLIPPLNPLVSKFPSVSRSSLILSAPNQEKIENESLMAHPAPETKIVTSPYGWRRRPYSGQIQFHKGIDYAAPLGSPVVSADDGVVLKVVSGCADFGNKWCGSQFGNWIEIDHGDGMVAIYAHLRNRSIAVRKGMKVRKNQQIARVGSSGWSTGAHLDFRLKVNGDYKNPKDFVAAKKQLDSK